MLGGEAVRPLLLPAELRGVRLDGPVAFRWNRRLFAIARKHLPGAGVRKRTALYEITGDLEGGPIRIVDHGQLPSAGDTSYAGVARIRGSRFLATWYSSPPAEDPSWIVGFSGRTDIWKAELDLSRPAALSPTPRGSVPGSGCFPDVPERGRRQACVHARPHRTAPHTPRAGPPRERRLHVALLWHPSEDALTVTVADARSGECFELPVDRQRALHAFEHPFAYAA